MRIENFVSLISQFLMLRYRNDREEHNNIDILLDYIKLYRGKTVFALLKDLSKTLETEEIRSGAKNIETELVIRELGDLRNFLRTAQSKKAVIDSLSDFITLLEKNSSLSPEQIVGPLSEPLTQDKHKSKRSVSSLREGLIEKYTKRLQETASSLRHEEFDSTLSDISTDKQVRKPELKAIAASFLGYEVPAKANKNEMIRMVKDRYNVNVRQKARSS